MASTKNITNNSELYNCNIEHLPEDIISVNKQEDAEQQRRIADTEGENNKRVLAGNMSELLGESLRTTWFQQGSSFVLNLIGSVRTAAVNKASNISATVSSTAGGAKQLAQDTKQLAQDTAVGIKNKGIEGAQNLALGLQDKSVEAKSFVTDKVFEYSQRLKDAVSLSFYKAVGDVSDHIVLTFSLMEQETERARRMNSSDEKYAIQNAIKVAGMIKGLSALYRPSSEPYALYSSKLLEEAERVRRISEVQSDNKTAITNAKAVSELINHEFNTPAQITLPAVETKLEFNEAQQPKSAFTPAL